MSLYFRFLVCLILAGITLYAFVENQNRVNELKLAIPQIAKKVKNIKEQNNSLVYEIEQFESPIHLMELARKPEYTHLKYPYNKDVMIIDD